MKRYLLWLVLLFLAVIVRAQQDGARPVTASQAIQNQGFTIQVGTPMLGTTIGQPDRTNNPADVRFPWDVLYLFDTFAEESFDVSKGYFGDKILISWTLRANFDLVQNISIYRREYSDDNSNPFTLIANTAPIATEYEDLYVDGGVLYEYRIEAQGIGGAPERYKTFITGIGYRSPTAIVTGSVNFEGGNPVQDVIVRATSQGSFVDPGNSLAIPGTTALDIEMGLGAISNAATLQAFLKPQNPFVVSDNPVKLFSLTSDTAPVGTQPIDVTIQLLNNELIVSVGGNNTIIREYFPSGELSPFGDDILIPVSEFNTSFVHFSIAMQDNTTPLIYINGRAMNAAYQSTVDLETYPGFEIVESVGTTSLSDGGNAINWNNLKVGGQKDSFVDEIRVWKSILEAETIRTDYRRYINGNNSNLISYLRANEGVGKFAYDLSRNGFNHNNNHGELFDSFPAPIDAVSWESDAQNIPSNQQLGVLGVTDENGNYEITAIPYTGTGESFTITPLLGVHEFDPGQQLVFLGQGAEVVNSINFTDISSFSFKGRVLYDSRGIFPPIAGDEVFHPDIDEVGYNQYDVGGTLYQKGEWWRNDNDTPTDPTDDYLEHYAKIYSEGVNIFIDGEIVLDENNIPVTTDNEGFFDISVPIGNHYISIGKSRHDFLFEGRFPADAGEFREFFEDSNQPETFIDNTRLSLVGRVVGGSVESAKPIGFGADGIDERTYTDADGNPAQIVISSINNIGTADLTLGYQPPGGSVTFETSTSFSTNVETGEYRIDLLPLNYSIDQTTGASLQNNVESVVLLDSNETINLFNVPEVTTPEAQLPDGTIVTGQDYHQEKSIVYRSVPVLQVERQTSDSVIEIDGTQYATVGFEIVPGDAVKVYSQLQTYTIDLKRFERYTNYDGPESIETQDPIIDGELLVTNNLALDGSESIVQDAADPSVLHYTFRGGLPNISLPFTRGIDLQYRIQGVDYPAENYEPDGIILGGIDDGSSTFITQAPDVPDFILRDPPGSNSYATIESGQTLTLNVSSNIAENQGVGESVNILLGVKLETGGGLAGPVIESQGVNEATLGIEGSYTSETGRDLSKSFTFNQSISTSDATDFVGSDGDLFIGQSKNYSYGSYDDVYPSTTTLGIEPALELTNNDGESIFISKQKSMYFNENPSDTFFVLSQRNILETTIPELEQIIENIDLGIITPGADGVQSRAFYVQQINLWRKTILDNEIAKYRAFTDPQTVKAEVLARIDQEIATLNSALEDLDNGNFPDVIEQGELADLYSNKIVNAQLIRQAVEANFEDNISFDAGVGSIERSVETSTVIEVTNSYEIEVEASFAAQLGFTLNSVGIITSTSGQIGGSVNSAVGESTENTSTIGYTLQDNDPDNLLSVDVINMFDGSGVVFATVGGRTSCPYEDEETAIFYNHTTYDPNAETIDPLPEGTGSVLGAATQRVEVPILNVEVASVTNIPESENAEFVLILENNSVTETDADFVLRVDNTTNPNNAIINIEPNGTIVTVPYGEQTFYALTLAKSISDVFVYDDIRIVLESFCDGEDVSDDVLISATFVPACSSVSVGAPLENWVFNRDIAFNSDGSSNPLPIELQGYNLSFDSFQKIDLEYRLATSPSWTRLQTFYTTQAFYDDALANSETDISLIEDSTVSYPFDIVAASLQDGQYEIRARTSCVNGTEFISEPIIGTVDLTSPRRFNAPSPQDGILSSGDDIKVSFNEPIFYNSALSQISITGRTNQLPINNSVSVRFDGAANTSTIVQPPILNGDFSLEFWMLNETATGNATILSQDQGVQLTLNGNNATFTLGGASVTGSVTTDGLFHHYTFTYDETLGILKMYRDDTEVDSQSVGVLQITNDNDLTIGGNTFIGNIHDLRLWSKSITLSDAFANIYTEYIGNEKELIGYWPMDEGRGLIARDKARFNNMIIDAAWDIKPKTESYLFEAGQYQTLDNVGFVQLDNAMDATISFWMKTNTSQEATIFSNGRGDGSDLVQSNGLTNKWAINLAADGNLTFASEGTNYPLTTQSVVDNDWHHIALLLNRNGSLITYVDGEQVSSNDPSSIGGFSGGSIWLGARGQSIGGPSTIDRMYTGQLDEFRLWNTVRNVEQIKRDQYMEIDPETIGLLLYARMNEPDPVTGLGPTYYHIFSNEVIITSEALLSSGTVNYNIDAPPIKPEREVLSFQVNRVINEDEMILEPVITDLAAVEGQILDITVHRMFDAANNRQESPITWTAFINKNDVSWYTPAYNNNVVNMVKAEGETTSFEITIVNQGGQNQPYEITNIPNWLTIENAQGTLPPSTTITLNANIDADLTAGDYFQDLFLETDFGFDQKIQIDLKVLAQEPDWSVNPNDYQFSMNIIGRIRVDNIFSQDPFDRIGAFVNGEVRGSTELILNTDYQEYFVFLTVYSNENFGENIDFRIWDASQGSVLPAIIDGDAFITFAENNVLGTLSQPKLFENTGEFYQQVAFNGGWTWISFNVNDTDFQDVNTLTQGMQLATSDRITSNGPLGALIDLYYEDLSNPDNSGWSGTISVNGGLTSQEMYKVYLANQQQLTIHGTPVDITTWQFNVQENWNWFPYPFNSNHSVNESLALFNAQDGDVIKSQTKFAIYDPINGWTGTLNSLTGGEGYMLKATTAQTFSYPTYLNRNSNINHNENVSIKNKIGDYTRFTNNMNAVVRLPQGYEQLYIYDANGRIKGYSAKEANDLVYITIYGEGEEELRYYVSIDGNTLEPAKNQLVFKNSDVLGTTREPIILDLFTNDMHVYPNPFEEELIVEFNVDKEQEVTLLLYNAVNQLVLTKRIQLVQGLQSFRLETDLAKGIYFLHVEMQEETFIEKLINK